MLRVVESLDSELAVKRLVLEYGEFKSQTRDSDEHGIGRINYDLGKDSPWQGAHRSIVAMVSITEEFFVERMRNVINSRKVPHDAIVMESLKLSMDRVEQNWGNRTDYARKWFNLDLSREPLYVAFSSFVVARNSIVHGNGRLTGRQAGSDDGQKVRSQLMSVGIRVVGNFLEIDDSAIQHCLDSARGVVMLLDAGTRSYV
jgi:hypothetical protein